MSDAISFQAPPVPPNEDQNESSDSPSAPLPPSMASARQQSVDEVVAMLNRTPLFMTSLDESDGEGGENVELEALKALAYEGTRAEVAANFKEQGNELAKVKQWSDAKEFYDKALAALKGPRRRPAEDGNGEEGPADVETVELDEAEEGKKEKRIEEACLVNRALCNLEKQNYRSCNLDCAAALRLNPRNVKAWYRSASACLALDKLAEAEDACLIGLGVEPTNAALKTLSAKIMARKSRVDEQKKKRQEREERKIAEERTLRQALTVRNVRLRQTTRAPDMEDAEIKLADPLDASSTLSFPVLLLYPLHMQSDFVKSFKETEALGDHLAYILPPPWDERGEYTTDDVECYIETTSGGLIKAGKKVPLLKILNTGKAELVDGLLKVSVVPKVKAAPWIDEFKKNKAIGVS